MESWLTRDELIKMYEKASNIKLEDKRFAAALKGIDLGEGKTTEFEEVERRALAKAHGLSEEQFELDGLIGIEYDEGDDLE